MVMFSKYLVLIYGLNGSGKDEFIENVISVFEPEKWDIHYLNLSSELNPIDFYNTIMSCNLVRMGPNHYTGAGDKSVLIVLQGFERLPVVSNNSVIEFLRSLFDMGRVVNPQKETTRFTSVYFLVDFSTEIIGPQNLPIPERLRRHVFPVLCHQTNKTLPYEVGYNFLQVYSQDPLLIKSEEAHDEEHKHDKDPQTHSDEDQEKAFKDCLMRELVTAITDIPVPIVPLCHKLMTCLEDLIDEDIFNNQELHPFTLLQLPDDEQPLVYDYITLEGKIAEYLEKKGKTEVLHSYLIRQFGFLYKIVQLNKDGHCILIGEPENEPAKMVELVADVSDVYLEAPPAQMTEIYWKETVVKVIHMCTKENRKVILHVTDDMPSHDCLQHVLHDLTVLLCGGFPMRLFQQQTGTNGTTVSSISSNWDKRKELTFKMRQNLHVIITINRRTVGHYRSLFFELFHFCMLVNLDNWTSADMLSYASMNLAQLKMQPEQIRHSVGDLMKIHKLMMELNPKFEHSEFVSFIQTYCHMATRKKDKLDTLMNRYQTGIEKLNKANEQMNYMQEELVRLQPELVRTSLETTMLMSQIERETIEIENAREIVAANEFKANEAATKAQALKVECEAEVAEAIPALEASVAALEVLSQRDISMLKTMRNPPSAVRLCMEAVCILLGEQPVKVKQNGKSKLDYWPTALKCLSDMQFLRRIRLFAKDKVPPNIMYIIRKNYISLEEFSPAAIRATSVAAESLCLWVRALESYDTISKQVEPKKQRLKNAEMMVKSNMKQLDSKRKALTDVTERLQHLSDLFSQQSQKKQELQNQIQACEQRVQRAVHLLTALGGERSRWEKNIVDLENELQVYRRTMLIAAAMITYLGNVEDTMRKKAISLTAAAVRYEKAFTMRVILDHTSILYDEKKEKLVENYTIIDYSRKPPFIIDPHGESHRMLPRLLGDNMMIVDLIKPDVAEGIKVAIEQGKTLILDNVSAPPPLCVTQVVKPKFVFDEQKKYLQVESHLLECHPQFRVYLRSDRLDKFTVDFLKNVTVVNVSLGRNVIQENVMNLFLSVNLEEMTQKRDELSDEKTSFLIQLDALEEKIMDVLGKSKDLDNDRVMDMLGGVRELSQSYESRSFELNALEEKLEKLSKKFKELAIFASRLIFISMNLSKLSPFYLRTLKFYFQVFKEAVQADSATLNEGRVEDVKAKVLKAFNEKITNSLFAQHRAVFEFLTKNDVGYKDLQKMSEKDFIQQYTKHMEPTDLNLRQTIIDHDSRIPIAILLNAQSTYVVRNLYTISRQVERIEPKNSMDPNHNPTRIQMAPVENLKTFDWRNCLIDDQWLMVQNCQHLDGDQIIALEALIDLIANAEERRETFRMFLIIYPEKGEAQHSLMGKCKVITLDDDYSLKGFLQYCYSTISPSWLHDQLDTAQRREMLYRLCCFHYCIVERCKYGIFGWITDFTVSTVNFESAANLFKDLCDRWSEITFNSLCSNVLEIAYLADMTDKYDLLVFRTIAQWIFAGLNKHDNATIDNLHLKTYNSTAHGILDQVKKNLFPRDTVMSGLNDIVIRATKKRQVVAVKKVIVEMLHEDEDNVYEVEEEVEEDGKEYVYAVTSSNEEEVASGVEYCVRNEIRAIEEAGIASKRLAYLKSLLEQSEGIQRVEIRHFQRPQAILEQLKQDYAKRQKLPLDELLVYGTLRTPVTVDFVEFAGCYIFGAGYDKDYNCLQEARKPIQPVDSVYVLVKRKNLQIKAETLRVPLYYKQLNAGFAHLLDVEIESNIPPNHWLLRGVKLCTTSPIKMEMEEE
ncbi:unnamed protein product [Bursaphelenchus okinawaensis]|uniref:Uncharacterized protein n=1 Tax=Bursaphelenchus okinawaensis TaxID=465554 RepID=A0A811KNN8_9BILA|nr:unnamed protein product [Bursaphelenchus okinawaensis]CAG9107396.1 unnamed protein product [Bursaphelenchus okinawaensis]